MMQSGRASLASSQVISGSGLAMANIRGLSAIERAMSWVTASFTESPMKTSAPSTASARVRANVLVAWADFHWFMPFSRPW